MYPLKKEFDSNSTYCEHNIDVSGIPSIFIHGVGLDNTMWLPQKNFFIIKNYFISIITILLVKYIYKFNLNRNN